MSRFLGQIFDARSASMVLIPLIPFVFAVIPLVHPAEAERLDSAESLAGTATVEVITEPALCSGGRLRFTGVPSGEIVLDGCEPGEPVPRRTLTALNLAAGQNTSTLSFIDQSISQAGYRLVAVQCDDRESPNPSIGTLASKRATFKIDSNESVNCKFFLSTEPACLCPEEGRWSVKNHRGTMACTGAVSLTTPLAPATTTGTIRAGDSCSTLYAEGMTDDEAPITYRRTGGCGYKGTVGGKQGGIPMEIHFTLDVENEEKLTGKLTSTVIRQGMTCNMNRNYELDFIGP